MHTIVLFTVDLVFTQIAKQILDKIISSPKLIVLNSYSDAKDITESENISLILVDDLIIGTSSYELISFLRLNRKLLCPIIYFGISEYEGEKKAISTGANHFINKPFNPDETAELIKNTLIQKQE